MNISSETELTFDENPKRASKGPTCMICKHFKREEFDRALASGTRTQASIAREVGCSRPTVSRHANEHLLPELKAQFERDPELGEIDLLQELRIMYARMKKHLERAEQADNWQAIKAFHSESRADLEMLGKLTNQLNDRPVTNVLIAPEWLTVRAILFEALRDYPDARAAVADRLKALGG